MGRHTINKQEVQDQKAQKVVPSAPKSSFVKVSSQTMKEKRIPVYSYMVK